MEITTLKTHLSFVTAQTVTNCESLGCLAEFPKQGSSVTSCQKVEGGIFPVPLCQVTAQISQGTQSSLSTPLVRHSPRQSLVLLPASSHRGLCADLVLT